MSAEAPLKVSKDVLVTPKAHLIPTLLATSGHPPTPTLTHLLYHIYNTGVKSGGPNVCHWRTQILLSYFR